MDRFCVFCGNTPDTKTKEHIVPKWLISLTGDKNREWCIGLKDSHPRHFSASSFTFPSCHECNNRYSSIENQAKDIFIKLLRQQEISTKEVDLLLDWFDKVRVGIWLAFKHLDRNLVLPRFYITSRLAEKDRSLYVYRINDQHEGLHIFGVQDNPTFDFMPSCFGLLANGYFFVNASFEFMNSARLGFPFPKKISKTESMENYEELTDFEASLRPKSPVHRLQMPKPVLSFHQAILLDKFLDNECGELADANYVQNNLLVEGERKSKIFRERHGTITVCEDGDLFVEDELDTHQTRHGCEYIIAVKNMQNYILKLRKKVIREKVTSGSFRDENKHLNYLIDKNELIINHYKEKLRIYAKLN